MSEEERRLDLDQLDEDDPFEIDRQRPHLAKHDGFDEHTVYDMWESAPLFYPAVPPADWLMVAELGGRVVVVPLAKPNEDDVSKCRPIGCYQASQQLVDRYRDDQRPVR